MGLQKKVENTKASFYVICQQYNQLGGYLKAEAQAVGKQDRHAAWEANAKLHKQFQEMGEQLKNLGAAIDRFGGAPVMSVGVAGEAEAEKAGGPTPHEGFGLGYESTPPPSTHKAKPGAQNEG